MPSQRKLAPTATGRPPSRLVRWASWELALAIGLAALALFGARYLPRALPEAWAKDRATRWFLSSLVLNAVFAGVPLFLLILKHKQRALNTLIPADRAVTDFGWGLEIALVVGALNALAVQRTVFQWLQDVPTAHPAYYHAIFEIGAPKEGETHAQFMRHLVLFIFGWGVFPPIAEEIFFRGFLYAALRRHLKPVYAIFISAAAFASIHPFGEPMLATLILGVVVATIYEYSGSLLSPIMAHMGLNLAFVLFMANRGELAQKVPPWILIAGAAVFMLHFFVSSRYLFRKPR